MKPTTIFYAYQNAVIMKEVMRARYGSKYGIAVDKTNEHARRWQKYDRQARKFASKVEDILEKVSDNAS